MFVDDEYEVNLSKCLFVQSLSQQWKISITNRPVRSTLSKDSYFLKHVLYLLVVVVEQCTGFHVFECEYKYG